MPTWADRDRYVCRNRKGTAFTLSLTSEADIFRFLPWPFFLSTSNLNLWGFTMAFLCFRQRLRTLSFFLPKVSAVSSNANLRSLPFVNLWERNRRRWSGGGLIQLPCWLVPMRRDIGSYEEIWELWPMMLKRCEFVIGFVEVVGCHWRVVSCVWRRAPEIFGGIK